MSGRWTKFVRIRKHGRGCQHQWDPILGGLVKSPTILEPILVVGLGCSLGVRGFDPQPHGNPLFVGICRKVKSLQGFLGGPSTVSPVHWTLEVSWG